jgi:hypothetical protein
MSSNQKYIKLKTNKTKKEPFNLDKSLENLTKYENYLKTYQPKIKSVEKLKNKERRNIINYAKKHNINNKNYNMNGLKVSIFTEEKTTTSAFNQTLVKNGLGKYFMKKYPHMEKKKCLQIADNIFNFLLNERTKTKTNQTKLDIST